MKELPETPSVQGGAAVGSSAQRRRGASVGSEMRKVIDGQEHELVGPVEGNRWYRPVESAFARWTAGDGSEDEKRIAWDAGRAPLLAALRDIHETATRHKRASDLKRYLIADLERIERLSSPNTKIRNGGDDEWERRQELAKSNPPLPASADSADYAMASRDGYEVPLIGVPASASLDKHVPEFHNLGNDLEEWCEIRVRKDLIPKGATLVEAYLTEREIIVIGQPPEGDELTEYGHNCDAMGCGTLSHVLYRLPLPNEEDENDGAKTRP